MNAAGHRHLSRDRRRSRQPLIGLAAAAALLPILAAPTVSAGVLPEGPLTVRTVSPVGRGYAGDTLHGVVCQAPNTCTPVQYFSFWTPGGVARLDEAIKEDPDQTLVILAYSNGAQIAQTWLAEHSDDPDAPPADQLTFILMGNSTRAYGGVDKEFGISQPSQYQVIDIAREYDPVADFPDNPFNLLALANALSGSITMHDYRNVDIDDPNNIVWTEGNTTYVLVPTEDLPLLAPLRLIGLTALADQLNGPLKEIVDQGYDRSYIPESATVTADSTAVSVEAAPTETTRTVALDSVTPVATNATAAEPAPSLPEPEQADITDGSRKSAGSDSSSLPNRPEVFDKVTKLTRAAARQLKNVTEPLRSTGASRQTTAGSADDEPSSKRPTREIGSDRQESKSPSASDSAGDGGE